MLMPSVLPGSLSISGTSGSVFSTTGFKWDYAISDLPFLSGASRQYPIVRESAQIRKQQWDTSAKVGEQSLEGWWLRSQISAHGGAGQLYLDVNGGDDDVSFTRFHSSRNADVWTAGKVTLLPAPSTTTFTGTVDATEVTIGGVDYAAVINSAQMRIVGPNIFTHSPVDSLLSPVGTLYAITTDGSYLYLATSGGLYSAPMPAAYNSSMTWTKEYTYTATNGSLAFVKSRIMLGLDNNIYEIAPHPAGMPAALPTAKYTHPDTSWRWTYFTEMTNAIYVVGNNGRRGSIIKFLLSNTTGAVPTLSAGNVAAQLPSGEVVYSACGYMGAFMGIGTNKGVRVATSDSNGDLTYGPLLFSTTSAVRGWSARDRFLFCGVQAGVDGDSGVYRIDLSNQVGELRFAYATDINVVGDTGAVAVVVHQGASDRYCYATPTAVYYLPTTATLSASGYVRTSRVRFGTLEPKHFKFYKLRGPALAGAISVQVLDMYDNTGASFTFPSGAAPGDADVAVTAPGQSQDFVSMKITLNRGAVTTTGAELWGWQLKALPATPRQRMIQLPLLCYDFERDKLGNRRGAGGTAAARLFALETLERTGVTVQFQDYSSGESANCVIEQVRFTQDEPPSGFTGFGGLIVATLRTL